MIHIELSGSIVKAFAADAQIIVSLRHAVEAKRAILPGGSLHGYFRIAVAQGNLKQGARQRSIVLIGNPSR